MLVCYNTEVLNLKFGYKALYTSGVLNWKSKCTAFEYIRLSNKSGGGIGQTLQWGDTTLLKTT